MNEVEMNVEGIIEEEDKGKRQRFKMYKGILNYVKGRCFSLNVVLASQQPGISIPPHEKTRQQLEQSYKSLYEDITLILSIKDCLKVAQNVITRSEIKSINNKMFISELVNNLKGMLYFSKSLMKLYDENYSEIALMEKKKEYLDALTQMEAYLKQPKGITTQENSDKTKEFEKASRLVYKINLIRAMKATLIGFMSLNQPGILSQVKNITSPLVRNLTLTDFIKSWDVGSSSQIQ